MQATPSKVGNNTSLAQSNEGKGDENIGTAQMNNLKAHSGGKKHNKNCHRFLIPKNHPVPQNAGHLFSKLHHYCHGLNSFLVCCWTDSWAYIYSWIQCIQLPG